MILARIKNHPTETDCVIIDVPPDLNKAMGTFGPARFDKDHRGFVCLVEHLESFYRFARFQNIDVRDERAFARAGHRTWPQECRHCAQAGSYSQPPKRCPACGNNWEPITPQDIPDNDPRRSLRCECCGHKNFGRFPYCVECGGPLNHEPGLKNPVITRDPLEEPVQLSTALVEYVHKAGWTQRPEPIPVAPRSPVVVRGRRVVDRDLLANVEDATVEPGNTSETGSTNDNDGWSPTANIPDEEETIPWYARD